MAASGFSGEIFEYATPSWPGSSSLPNWPLSGDFYNVQDDVYRGVSLATFGAGPYAKQSNNLGDVKFSDSALPLELSEEHMDWTSGATMITLNSSNSLSPATVATALHQFVVDHVNASFSKVRPAKFTMTVDAFEYVAGVHKHCMLKIRVFRLSTASTARSRLAVDIQRRSGDGLAFNRFYQRAVDHLRERLGVDTGSQPQQAVETRLPEVMQETKFEPPALRPLLDMVSCTEPSVLAEGLSALASIVGADAATAEAVCSELASIEPFRTYGIASFVDFLNIHYSIAVAFSAAQLVTALCQSGIGVNGRIAKEQESLLAAVSELTIGGLGSQRDFHPLVQQQLQKCSRVC